jgi:hypothetical protein
LMSIQSFVSNSPETRKSIERFLWSIVSSKLTSDVWLDSYDAKAAKICISDGKNIDPAFRNRRNVLHVGDPVFHGIRTHTNGKFEASNIGIYSRDEIDRMAMGLQPHQLKSDPEPVAIEPQPVPAKAASEATPDSVLAPASQMSGYPNLPGK